MDRLSATRIRTPCARLTDTRLWKLMTGTPAGRIIRLVAAGASRR